MKTPDVHVVKGGDAGTAAHRIYFKIATSRKIKHAERW